MRRTVVVGVLAAVMGGAASAHHSTAMFSWGMEKSLHGTVSKWEWTQPHSFIWVDVPGSGGKVQQFGLEGMSPSWLGRRGWNNKTLSVGDKVTINYYPLRDGRPGGFFVRVTLPSGKVVEALPKAPTTVPAASPTSSSPPGSSAQPK
ncbi:MAG: DUF6152 family protein [Gammaproteobacteria bacterium]